MKNKPSDYNIEKFDPEYTIDEEDFSGIPDPIPYKTTNIIATCGDCYGTWEVNDENKFNFSFCNDCYTENVTTHEEVVER